MLAFFACPAAIRTSLSFTSACATKIFDGLSAAKIPSLDAVWETGSNDWVGGSQFDIYHLHHPVWLNRELPWRSRVCPFCGAFRR